jgi:hypothetical protein
MYLDLTDEEIFALLDLLTETIEAARYPFSPRIQTLRSANGTPGRNRVPDMLAGRPYAEPIDLPPWIKPQLAKLVDEPPDGATGTGCMPGSTGARCAS